MKKHSDKSTTNKDLIKRLKNISFAFAMTLPFCAINVAHAQVIGTEIKGEKSYLRYKMQPKETATMLADDFKVTLKDLEQANPDKDLHMLKYGEIIMIPEDNPQPLPPKELTRGEQQHTNLKEVAETQIKYVVKKNESIYAIAKKYEITINQIKEWNNIIGDKITPGQELIVRVNSKKNNRRNIENKGIATIQAQEAQKRQLAQITPHNKNNQGKTRGEGRENTNQESTNQESTTTNNQPKYDTTRIEEIVLIKHKIKEGETLASIARANNVSQDDIIKASNLKENYKAETDNEIFIPTKKISFKIVKVEETVPDVQEYVVKKGDNLGSIATKYHVSVQEIKSWNNIPTNSDNIKENQKLKLYMPVLVNHTIKKGESWVMIAKKYGVTEKQILNWNNIMEDENPNEKQEINIYKPSFKANKNPNPNKEQKNPTTKPKAVIKYHHIEDGDNYTKIRSLYNISSTEIKFWNGKNPNDDALIVGDSLKLYMPIEQKHIVKKGETPEMVSRKYGVNMSQVRIWNNIKPKNDKYQYDLTEGQELIIYEPTGNPPTKEYLEKKQSKNQKNETNTQNDKTQANKNDHITHTVGVDETLYKISLRYGVTVDEIKDWNNINTNVIREGETIKIFPKKIPANTENTKQKDEQIVKNNPNTQKQTEKTNTQPTKNNDTKMGDGNIKFNTPDPDADPLHQLNQSTPIVQPLLKDVVGDKNKDNETNQETETDGESQIFETEGLMQYNSDVPAAERFSVLVSADKIGYSSVDITNPKTGASVNAMIAGEIQHNLSPSIILEVTPHIIRTLGYSLGDVPKVKLTFKK